MFWYLVLQALFISCFCNTINDYKEAYKAIKLNNIFGIGAVCKDGVIMVSVPFSQSKSLPTIGSARINMDLDELEDSSNVVVEPDYNKNRKCITKIDDDIIVTIIGIPSDCNYILDVIKSLANEYKRNFDVTIPLIVLADQLSDYLHSEPASRPFAVDMLLGSADVSNDVYLDENNSIIQRNLNGKLLYMNCAGDYHDIFSGITETFNKDDEESKLLNKFYSTIKKTKWLTLTCSESIDLLKGLLDNDKYIQQKINNQRYYQIITTQKNTK